MRAILFASATVTSLTGRRSRIALVQTPAALFQGVSKSWGSLLACLGLISLADG